MAKQQTTQNPLRAAEQAAYDAYREWPVFLVVRLKELQAHLGQAAPVQTEKSQMDALVQQITDAGKGQHVTGNVTLE